MQLHHAEPWFPSPWWQHAISAFPTGYEAQIQTVRTHSNRLTVYVGSHTNTSLPLKNMLYCYQFACLPVPFLAFQPYRGHRTQLCWKNRAVSRCADSRDSVTYDCATWTRLVSSKFFRNTWGAAHVWTVDTRCSSPICQVLGKKVTHGMCHTHTHTHTHIPVLQVSVPRSWQLQ